MSISITIASTMLSNIPQGKNYMLEEYEIWWYMKSREPNCEIHGTV